ncbi:MAG: hypothetical protein HRT88_04495 [Lentisphaeraceae bacterium]|nr:hypothetical protein [Lentisphaeraceae bacterium]
MDTVFLIRLELGEMARYKWLESEKAGHDLGEEAMLEWVELYIDEFLRRQQQKKLV